MTIRIVATLIFALALCISPQSIHSVATEAEQDINFNVWIERDTGDICSEFWYFGNKYPNKTNSHWTTYHNVSPTPESHPYPHVQYLTWTEGLTTFFVVDFC